jgi:hypothetical protein
LLGVMLACAGALVGCGTKHADHGGASTENPRTVASSGRVSSTVSPTSPAGGAQGGSAPSPPQTPPAGASLGGLANAGSFPVLSEVSFPEAARGMPQRLLRRIAAQDRAALAQLKAAARAPVSTRAGCYQVRKTMATAPGSPRWFGYPFAPTIDAHLIGHHVEVAFSFPRWSKSLACRPAVLTLVVSGQHPGIISPSTPAAQRGLFAAIMMFRIVGPRGRVISSLPLGEPPPYSVRVSASVINNNTSAAVISDLTCPYSPSTTVGCEPPARVGNADAPDPILPSGPLKPLRHFSRLDLQQSVAWVTAHQPIKPRVVCPSTTRCRLTYLDRATGRITITKKCQTAGICQATYHSSPAPPQPYTIDYKIAAEQVPGCWMAMRDTSDADLPPYVYSGADDLAGCRRWPT